MHKLRFVTSLIIATILFLLPGCKKGSTPTTPSNPASLPIINSFSASPEKVTLGSSSTLSWNVSNADKAEIDQGLGQVALIGSISVKPNSTTVYTLTATKGSQTSIKTCQVTVENLPDGKPTINSFSASPEKVTLGSTSTLSWNVSNAQKVEIDQEIGQVALTGSVSVKPNSTTIYTLTATNGSGPSIKTCQVTVENPPDGTPIINSFNSSPGTIILESSSTLSWDVKDAQTVEIDQGIGVVSAVGSRSVSPTATTTYTLTAKNGAKTATKSCSVTVDWRSFVCYKTNTGEKYHRNGCQYLSQSKIQTTLGAACQSGLGPCSVCNPPKCR